MSREVPKWTPLQPTGSKLELGFIHGWTLFLNTGFGGVWIGTVQHASQPQSRQIGDFPTEEEAKRAIVLEMMQVLQEDLVLLDAVLEATLL